MEKIYIYQHCSAPEDDLNKLTDPDKKNQILKAILDCRLCDAHSNNNALCIDYKEVGLKYFQHLSIPIEIMFVAESPPAPGKGFFYDKASKNNNFRNKLFKLLNNSGLGMVHSIEDFHNKGYYLADAINCRWDKSKRKSLPTAIFQNCAFHLSEQIEFLKPKIIVAMGLYAQKSLRFLSTQTAIKNLSIPKDNIIEMSFILVASNETDEQRIKKFYKISRYVNQ